MKLGIPNGLSMNCFMPKWKGGMRQTAYEGKEEGKGREYCGKILREVE